MVGTSHSRTSIDIQATVRKHSNFVSHILAAHTLSGCDTVASLYGIGKGTIVKLLKTGHQLNLMGDIDVDMEDIIAEVM